MQHIIMFCLANLNNKINNDEDFTEYLQNELAIDFIKYKIYKSNGITECVKRYDYMYKKLVKQNAHNKCQITGYIGVVCEVAHIFPFAMCKLNSEKYDPANGIFICSNIHKLLDNTKYINIVYDGVGDYGNNIDVEKFYIKINADMCTVEEFVCARKILHIVDDTNIAPIHNMSYESKKYIDRCTLDAC